MLAERSIELLESGCSMVVGLVAPDGRPIATRGWGMDLADGGLRARVLLGAAALEAVGYEPPAPVGTWIATTGSNVITLHSAQLKGRITAVLPVGPADLERMGRYCDVFFDDVAVVDSIPRHRMERLVPDAFVACEFTVIEAYDQTPGPGAWREPGGRTPVTGTVDRPLTLADLDGCFNGLIPAVLATVSASGVPNVTYVSRVHPVDDERIALSNQFLSKSSRNLAEVPRASILLIRPGTHEEFRLDVVFERTERRGPVFDRLRNDVSMIAALTGMQDVFKLASADICRVEAIEQVVVVDPADLALEAGVAPDGGPDQPGPHQLGELCGRLSRCGDLDTLLRVALEGLADLLGHAHSQLLLLDESGTRLFTIASHGYDEAGIGAEVAMGDGIVGAAAERCAPVAEIGNLRQSTKYARTVRRSFEDASGIGPGREVPMVGLARPGSQLAVPALALGQLVGVLLVEDDEGERFSPADAAMLTAVTSILASTVESLRAEVRTAGAVAPAPAVAVAAPPTRAPVLVRHFTVDGSTFLDGDYLIKGVAGRLLWSLLRQHEDEARTEFTNREVRLDRTLDLPDFRDNFESRLIMLMRRLDERSAPVRIEKTGRGRFRLLVTAPLRLQAIAD